MKTIFSQLLCGILILTALGCNQQPKVPTGELVVMTEPEDAVVEVNGKILGTTPLSANIPAGKLLMKVRKEGFETEWRTLYLAAGDRLVPELKLRPLHGLVVINSEPQGAAVSLGEVYAGTTPLTLHTISRGRHRARLVLSGYDDKEIEFEVRERIPQALNVELNSNAGILVIHSNPPGASVFVDGRSAGVTPLSLDQIGRGEQDLSLQLSGYEPYRSTVVISPAATTRVDANLTPLPGGLSIVSVPNGGRVYIDGEFRGEAPVNLRGIEPGAYSVRVELRGHAAESRTVRVDKGESVVEEFQLVRNSGTLQIITRPAEVSVNIDGEFMGKTLPGSDASDVVSRPLIIDMLSQGSHTLQLVREGYTFETKRFFITKDEVTALEETLERKFIPNVILRIGEGPDDVITGVLQRRHLNGDIEMEVRKGIFRTFPMGSYLSLEPLKQEEEVENSPPPTEEN
ncbi:MAG: PEGA domain-containing protein [Kiritimatiellia bacterium]